MSMSAAHTEAYARADVNVIHVYLVEMRHDAFPLDILRFVNHDKDITHTLEATAPVNPGAPVTFVGRAGSVAEGSSDGEADSPFNILLDGVWEDYQPFLYNAAQDTTSTTVEVTIRIIGYNIDTETVVGVAGVLNAELLNAKMDLTNINLVSGYSNSANVAFPSVYFTPENSPGLYT
jgi:hypothetical protein